MSFNLKPISPKKVKKPEEESTMYLEEVIKTTENHLLPHELQKECPISVKLYNTFEKFLPTTGHFALLVASCLGSMWTDEPRQTNLTIAALPTQGKTSVLRRFAGYKYANFFTKTTYANYVIKYCGKFLVIPGHEKPSCIKVERTSKGKIVSTEECEDRITNFFDIIHAGEGIVTTPGFPKLLTLWNALIDEGYWQGGDRYSGEYKIGSEMFPVKHGLIFACTLSDLKNKVIRQEGTLSRTVTGIYHCTEKENIFIIKGKTPPRVHIPRVDFTGVVKRILSDLETNGPFLAKRKMSYSGSLNEDLTRRILQLIMVGRGETTGKRASDDRLQLLKGHARLNNRDKVTIYDAIMLEALLQMCRKIKGYFYGTRLHFQVWLRYLLHGDINLVKREMKSTFKWWDSDKPLYIDDDIDEAFKMLRKDITYDNFDLDNIQSWT